MRPENNSGDFGRFLDYLADSNSEFVVAEIISKKQFDFSVCPEFIHTQCDLTLKHVLLHMYTHLLMCLDRCRHTVERKEKDRKRDSTTTSRHHYTHTDPHHIQMYTTHFHSNCGCVF